MAKAKKETEAVQDFSKYIRWFWIVFLGGIISIFLIFLLTSIFGDLPDHTQLENPRTNLATEIISSDSKTLGKFYFKDNRTPINYNELSQHLVDALVATEDVRFHEHSGIDARGTLRAFFFLGGRGGASTISQQLSRHVFVGVASRSTISRIM